MEKESLKVERRRKMQKCATTKKSATARKSHSREYDYFLYCIIPANFLGKMVASDIWPGR